METIQKKQRAKSGKKKGQIRYVSTTAPKASFFHFFTKPTEEEEDSDEEEEEKEDDRVTFNIEEDYDIAHAIRTAIIPHAVGWFTGELIEEEDEEDVG